MSLLSWKRYDEQSSLSQVLTEAARACVDAQPPNPSEFLTSYFAVLTKGDSVDTLQVGREYVYGGGGTALCMQLRLATRIDVRVRACPLLRAGAAGEPVALTPAETAALVGEVEAQVAPALQRVGVTAQTQWDTALAAARVRLPTPAPAAEGDDAAAGADTAPTQSVAAAVPSSVACALSVAAVAAASKLLEQPLYNCVKSLWESAEIARISREGLPARPASQQAASATGAHGGSGEDDEAAEAVSASGCEGQVTLPIVLIPLLGRDLHHPCAAAVGSVNIHTLYLVLDAGPGAAADAGAADTGADSTTAATAAAAGGDASAAAPPAASASSSVSERVAACLSVLSRLLQERRTGTVRADGALVEDGFTDIADAVAAGRELAQQAGLEPGRDCSFGVRLDCPCTATTVDAFNATGGGAASGKGKKGAAAAKAAAAAAAAPPDASADLYLYTLFAGEAEVTGAQVADYLRQQAEACGGLLTLVEDTHDPRDVENLHRVQQELAGRAAVSGLSLYRGPDPRAQLEAGLQQQWTSHVAIDAATAGTLSAALGLCRRAAAAGRAVSLYALSADDAVAAAAADAAVGISSRYVRLPGLVGEAAFAALARLQRAQAALEASLRVAPRADYSTYHCTRLTPVSQEPVPEIKRRVEKKKKKGK